MHPPLNYCTISSYELSAPLSSFTSRLSPLTSYLHGAPLSSFPPSLLSPLTGYLHLSHPSLLRCYLLLRAICTSLILPSFAAISSYGLSAPFSSFPLLLSPLTSYLHLSHPSLHCYLLLRAICISFILHFTAISSYELTAPLSSFTLLLSPLQQHSCLFTENTLLSCIV